MNCLSIICLLVQFKSHIYETADLQMSLYMTAISNFKYLYFLQSVEKGNISYT